MPTANELRYASPVTSPGSRFIGVACYFFSSLLILRVSWLVQIVQLPQITRAHKTKCSNRELKKHHLLVPSRRRFIAPQFVLHFACSRRVVRRKSGGKNSKSRGKTCKDTDTTTLERRGPSPVGVTGYMMVLFIQLVAVCFTASD